METIFEILLDLLVELLGDLILWLGWESLSAAFRDQPKAHPALAALGYLLVGAVLGAVSTHVFPRLFSKHESVSMLGVFLNPLLVGLVSEFYGEWRRRRNRTTTNLATFWGDALFAFGVSATRLALILH